LSETLLVNPQSSPLDSYFNRREWLKYSALLGSGLTGMGAGSGVVAGTLGTEPAALLLQRASKQYLMNPSICGHSLIHQR